MIVDLIEKFVNEQLSKCQRIKHWSLVFYKLGEPGCTTMNYYVNYDELFVLRSMI